MATTVNAPVNNAITLAEKYLPILDEIYKAESKSSILDTAENNVRWIGAQTIQVFDADSVGLGNYSRNAGFEVGDVTQAWEDFKLAIDRGRSFMVDTMDNDETLGMAFSTLLGQFERTKVVPEVDAYRFAKYATSAGQTTTATLATDNMAEKLEDAIFAMDAKEVPAEGRIAFLSDSAYKNLLANVSRYVLNRENDIDNNIQLYNGLRIVRVPDARMATSVTLNAGTTSATAGGFTLGATALHGLIVHPSAVIQVVKHVIPRVFSPQVNQEADAWKFDYRIYHDAFVYKNKADGIYAITA